MRRPGAGQVGRRWGSPLEGQGGAGRGLLPHHSQHLQNLKLTRRPHEISTLEITCCHKWLKINATEGRPCTGSGNLLHRRLSARCQPGDGIYGHMLVVPPTADRLDGSLRHRVAFAGTEFAILPATCRLGTHSLASMGYRAFAQSGILSIECRACAADVVSDGHWHLSLDRPASKFAEFDDRPYSHLTQCVSPPLA